MLVFSPARTRYAYKHFFASFQQSNDDIWRETQKKKDLHKKATKNERFVHATTKDCKRIYKYNTWVFMIL